MNIRSLLTKRVAALRVPASSVSDLNEAVSNTVDNIVEGGVSMTRRRIVLNVHGCSVATCTMCPLPDESVPDSVVVTDDHVISQLRNALKDLNEDVLTVYNNGNFFSDKEISPAVKRFLYERVENSSVKILIVESLPAFINETQLKVFRFHCSKKLVVAIGLQSWNDDIREIAINSTCTKKAFLRAVLLLQDYSYGIQTFLMFKPPFVSTKEAIDDIVYSVRELNSLKIDSIVISPMRVTPNTLAWEMYQRGEYFPPSTNALTHCLYALGDVDCSRVRVATSILTAADGIDAVRISVTPEYVKAVEQFNVDHDGYNFGAFWHPLAGVDTLYYEGTVKERVTYFTAKKNLYVGAVFEKDSELIELVEIEKPSVFSAITKIASWVTIHLEYPIKH